MQETKSLSGRGEIIEYQIVNSIFKVKWGKTEFSFSRSDVNKILKNFFVNEKAWYPLGASMDPIFKDGMGEYLLGLNIGLTPRHGSAVAAILVEEEILESKGKKPIFLKRKSEA